MSTNANVLILVCSIEPFRMKVCSRYDVTGPAMSSKPSNEGATNVPLSGSASRLNSIWKFSPVATSSGALASKVGWAAARTWNMHNSAAALNNRFLMLIFCIVGSFTTFFSA